MECQAKLNEKYTLTVSILFQALKLPLIKDTATSFLFLSVFKSIDTIFHHFIQHYLKKDFRHKLLLFLTDSPQPSNLHNSQNLLSMTKVFFICHMAAHGQLLTTVEETASLIRCNSLPFPYSV